MSADSHFQWLEAAQGRGILPGLDRMRRLLAALGNPETGLRCLHVAGTNGKGSVCAFAESVLRAMGLRTGLYTSPHLIRFAERIRICGKDADKSLIGEGIGRLMLATSGWKEKEMPTYFELVTALAFDLFSRAGLDAVVLETGLGGRLDATNVAPKLACAITPIGLDHMEWLGNSLGSIAREKAGIFRRGIPAVTAPQDHEALDALREVAGSLGAPLRVVEQPVSDDLSLELAGSHQRWNAALALALVRAGGFQPREEAITSGLSCVSWPGRFQRLVHKGREVILDGAHNPHAAANLVSTWREEYGDRPCVLLFGVLADKDCEGILSELLPLCSELVLVPVSSPRSADPSEFLKFTDYSHPVPTVAGSLKEALEGIFASGQGGGAAVLVAGSLFLVGEALSLLSPGGNDP